MTADTPPTVTTPFGSHVARQVRCFGHRPGYRQDVRVPGGGNEAQPEPLQIVEGVVQRMDLQLAAIAGTRVDLADGQAAAQALARDLVQVRAEGFEFCVHHRRGFGERAAKALEEVS